VVLTSGTDVTTRMRCPANAVDARSVVVESSHWGARHPHIQNDHLKQIHFSKYGVNELNLSKHGVNKLNTLEQSGVNELQA
jgi:hypothetical protein